MSLDIGTPLRARARAGARTFHSILPLLLALASIPLLSPPLAGASTPERHVLRGKVVQVCNVIGDVRIVPAPAGGDVVVLANLVGPDASKLRVEVGECSGAKRLRIVYPSNRIVDPELGFGDRQISRLDGCCGSGRIELVRPGHGGLEARADLVIQVPRDQELKVAQAAGRIEAEGARANLDLETGSGAFRLVDVIGNVRIDSGSGEIRVEKSKGTVAIDTGSGEIEISDFDGTLEVDSGSGGVSVARLRSDVVAIASGSGRVTGDEVVAAKLVADTGSGRIEFSRLQSKEITFDTGSGGVFAELEDSPQSMRIDTGSGGVRLTTPADLDARIDITCPKGRLDLDVPVVASRRSDSRFQGKAGAGTGLIVIESGSGSVSLRPRTE